MLFHVLKIQIIQLALLIECFFIKQGKLFLSLLISVARGKFYFNFTEFREIEIFGWYSTKKAASKTQPFGNFIFYNAFKKPMFASVEP